jgi:ribonucleotide monophosphatase NagD (HAD superfamily)
MHQPAAIHPIYLILILILLNLILPNPAASLALMPPRTTKTATVVLPSLVTLTSSPSPCNFLLDVWGVLHEGTHLFPSVLPTLQAMTSPPHSATIISNSSKRRAPTITQLQSFGINTAAFKDVITSGEVAWNYLASLHGIKFNPRYYPAHAASLLPFTAAAAAEAPRSAPLKVLMLGSSKTGAEDSEYVATSGCVLAENALSADVVLARGLDCVLTSSETVLRNDVPDIRVHVNSLLAQTVSRNVPLLIANPDKVRPDEALTVMPGTIGDDYRKIGGSVVEIGKPNPDVFNIAMDAASDAATAAAAQWYMVGDALHTDIRGSNAVPGVKSVWCYGNGIHGKAISAASDSWEKIVEEMNVEPDFVVKVFGHDEIEK